MIASAQPARVELDWIRSRDDEGIRRLLRELAMEGDIRLAMARDPCFGDALCVEGHAHDVLVARDADSGHVVGLGTRSLKPAYTNGVKTALGYLSGLRARPDYRNGRDFFRAYRMMRRAHQERPAPVTLTTILEENQRAVRLLTSGRLALPSYHALGRYHTLCYAPRRYPEQGIRQATNHDREAILAFLHQHGPSRQFFPAYTESDFGTGPGLLRNLGWEELLLAEDRDGLVGCLGLWDQREFRQSRVEGYSRRLGAVRPGWNLLAPLHRRPRLPAPGRIVDHRFAALACVVGDDARIFGRLLRAALTQAARQGAGQVAIGLHEHDPLLPAARHLPNLTLHSLLYVVTWPEDGDPRANLDGRVPYLELGGL